MSDGDFYIRKVETINNVEHIREEKLISNGNAFEFDCGLQTGDGDVTQLVANTNNYSPDNWSKVKHFVLDASTPLSITGAVAGADWQEALFWNKSTNAITLTHDDALSTASNRFYCEGGASVVLNQFDGCYLAYDPDATRWRVKK